MTKLIYHLPETRKSNISPFDKSITKMVKGKSLCIVSPYIGLTYLKRILNFASDDWRLITDIQAAFNVLNTHQRKEFKSFIESNHRKIHHQSGVHAKAIITSSEIFLGSSNLTDRGIKNNNEVSVIINDNEDVLKLQRWFDEWWNITSKIDISLLEQIEASKVLSYTDNKNLFYNPDIAINSRLVSITSKSSIKDKLTEVEILHYISSWGDPEWIHQYLDLIGSAVDYYNIDNTDQRIALTFVNPKGGKPRINFIVGFRYVLSPIFHRNNKTDVGLMLPLEFDYTMLKKDRISDKHRKRLKQQSPHIYFKSNKGKEQAIWIEFKADDKISLGENIIGNWIDAIGVELNRTNLSKYQKYHQSAIYNLVQDKLLRKELMQEKDKV